CRSEASPSTRSATTPASRVPDPGERSSPTTIQPSAVRRSAIARPMPLPLPVTTTLRASEASAISDLLELEHGGVQREPQSCGIRRTHPSFETRPADDEGRRRIVRVDTPGEGLDADAEVCGDLGVHVSGYRHAARPGPADQLPSGRNTADCDDVEAQNVDAAHVDQRLE